MTTAIPAQLKSADISRFATRANQVEKVKPVISYWCNYWVVNQILSKGLHNSDEECLKFTTGLMDKLEKFKSEYADNDTVTDDVAGQAYVEQFAMETFQRAENAVQANKATLQTADTFQAAATFLELSQIWGKLDDEVAAKVKFAKYHALRIFKAVKAGEDPNESNPSTETQEGQNEGADTAAGGQNGPEVVTGQHEREEESARPRQASVEEIPDDADNVQRNLAQQSSLNESIHPSRSSSAAPPQLRPEAPPTSAAANAPNSGAQSPMIFPTGMMDMDKNPRQRPSHLSQATVPDLPAAPSDFPSPASSPAGTPFNLGAPPEAFPPVSNLQSFPPPTSSAAQPPQQPHGQWQTPQPAPFPEPDKSVPPPATSVPAPSTSQQPPRSVPSGSSAATGANAGSNVDEDAIAQAQKHARWAVSALNFDDVNTAIKELRNSLKFLGS